MQTNKFWVPGIPVTFATKHEKIWREEVKSALLYLDSINSLGLKLDFILPTLAPYCQPLDVDNLCEPVIYALVGQLKWFSGKRPNIQILIASKKVGDETGVLIEIIDEIRNDVIDSNEKIIFDEIYSNIFPQSATDTTFPLWIKSKFIKKSKYERFKLFLEFGSNKINIGNISSGIVKPIIDCLFPIIGGTAGYPEDWRINEICILKNKSIINEEFVRIKVLSLD